MPNGNNYKELARFSVNGKTFFFNEAQTRKGGTYLQINALQGDRKENLNVFEEMLLPFSRAAREALKQMTGLEEAASGKIPSACSKCEAPKSEFRAVESERNPDEFIVYCLSCKNIAWENVEGAGKRINKEAEDV